MPIEKHRNNLNSEDDELKNKRVEFIVNGFEVFRVGKGYKAQCQNCWRTLDAGSEADIRVRVTNHWCTVRSPKGFR